MFGLATRAGLAGLSGKKNFEEHHIINLLLTKLGRPRWLDTGLNLFFGEFVVLDSILVHKHAKKGLGQPL